LVLDFKQTFDYNFKQTFDYDQRDTAMTAKPPDATDDPAPRQRILDAAIDLFASKGYAATGVREIARAADVNQAMISYYYGSKINLLKAIFEQALKVYGQVIVGNLAASEDEPFEVRLKHFFSEAFAMMRRHHKLFRITWSELHYDVPEIAEFKAGLIRQTLLPALVTFLERHREHLAPGLRPEIIFPLLPGMVAWHFMTAPVYTRVVGLTLDNAFYDTFADQLTQLVLNGLRGHSPAQPGEER
jgi:TetR/AcrR family transcriptional regulator